jgi:hypothetical protein
MGVLDDRMLMHRHQAAPAVKFSTLMLNMCRIFILRVQKYEDGIAHDGRRRERGPASGVLIYFSCADS